MKKAKGIYYNKTSRKWRACLMYGGKNIGLGTYNTFEEAVRAKRRKADMYRLDLSDEELFGKPMSEILETPP
jgi:hypothetical protein